MSTILSSTTGRMFVSRCITCSPRGPLYHAFPQDWVPTMHRIVTAIRGQLEHVFSPIVGPVTGLVTGGSGIFVAIAQAGQGRPRPGARSILHDIVDRPCDRP